MNSKIYAPKTRHQEYKLLIILTVMCGTDREGGSEAIAEDKGSPRSLGRRDGQRVAESSIDCSRRSVDVIFQDDSE